MSSVCMSYILQAPEGFKLNPMFSNITGVIVGILFFSAFMMRVKKEKNKVEKTEKVS